MCHLKLVLSIYFLYISVLIFLFCKTKIFLNFIFIKITATNNT